MSTKAEKFAEDKWAEMLTMTTGQLRGKAAIERWFRDTIVQAANLYVQPDRLSKAVREAMAKVSSAMVVDLTPEMVPWLAQLERLEQDELRDAALAELVAAGIDTGQVSEAELDALPPKLATFVRRAMHITAQLATGKRR